MVSFQDAGIPLSTTTVLHTQTQRTGVKNFLQEHSKIWRKMPLGGLGGKFDLLVSAISVAKKSLHQLAPLWLTPSKKIGVQNATSLS